MKIKRLFAVLLSAMMLISCLSFTANAQEESSADAELMGTGTLASVNLTWGRAATNTSGRTKLYDAVNNVEFYRYGLNAGQSRFVWTDVYATGFSVPIDADDGETNAAFRVRTPAALSGGKIRFDTYQAKDETGAAITGGYGGTYTAAAGYAGNGEWETSVVAVNPTAAGFETVASFAQLSFTLAVGAETLEKDSYFDIAYAVFANDEASAVEAAGNGENYDSIRNITFSLNYTGAPEINGYVETPEREGHEFLGWATAPNGAIIEDMTATTVPTGDTTYYAIWNNTTPPQTGVIESGTVNLLWGAAATNTSGRQELYDAVNDVRFFRYGLNAGQSRFIWNNIYAAGFIVPIDEGDGEIHAAFRVRTPAALAGGKMAFDTYQAKNAIENGTPSTSASTSSPGYGGTYTAAAGYAGNNNWETAVVDVNPMAYNYTDVAVFAQLSVNLASGVTLEAPSYIDVAYAGFAYDEASAVAAAAVVPNYKASDYVITFNPNYDDAQELDGYVETLERDGYEFLGWSASPNGEVIEDMKAAPFADQVDNEIDGGKITVTYYAIWEALAEVPDLGETPVYKTYGVYDADNDTYTIELRLSGTTANVGSFGFVLPGLKSVEANEEAGIYLFEDGKSSIFAKGEDYYANTWSAEECPGGYVDAKVEEVLIATFVLSMDEEERAEFVAALEANGDLLEEYVVDNPDANYYVDGHYYIAPHSGGFDLGKVAVNYVSHEDTVTASTTTVKVNFPVKSDSEEGGTITNIAYLVFDDGEPVDIEEVGSTANTVEYAIENIAVGSTHTIKVLKNGYIGCEFSYTATEDGDLIEITLVPGDIKGADDDLEGDGKIDLDDFVRVIRAFEVVDSDDDAYNAYKAYTNNVDIDESGTVTVQDLGFIKTNYGKTSDACTVKINGEPLVKAE